jgi:hypothetical protein
LIVVLRSEKTMTLATRCMARLVVAALLALNASTAQAAPRTKLIVIVIEDDAPAFAAKVVIRPTGPVAGWPMGKEQIELMADDRGRAWTRLGVGQYRVTAYQSIGIRLPAETLVTTSAENTNPIQVRLVLQYWDCTKVTCEI